MNAEMQIVQDYKKKLASLLKNDIVLVTCSGNFVWDGSYHLFICYHC